MSTALVSLTSKLAEKFGMSGADGVIDILKATAFKGQVSDAQMTALMVVANQYGLNPWTREIYAFPDKNNGIVPVVGVDGWSRIINEHPQFDGMEFIQDDASDSCTCIMHRKDRAHPIKVTEFMSECRRAVGPWQTHPKRMLRHKALIQCARLAFGFVGVFDPDEAERIIEGEVIDGNTGEVVNRRPNGAQVAQAAQAASDAARVVTVETGEPSERDTLIKRLETTAIQAGLDMYGQAWMKLTPTQRKIVGATEHARLKALAAAPVEAEMVGA